MATLTQASCTLNLVVNNGVSYYIPTVTTPYVDPSQLQPTDSDVITPADVAHNIYGGVSSSVSAAAKKAHHHARHVTHVHFDKFLRILTESICAVVGAALIAATFGAATPAVVASDIAATTALESGIATTEVVASTATTAATETIAAAPEAANTAISAFASTITPTNVAVTDGTASYGVIAGSLTSGLKAGMVMSAEVLVATAAAEIGEIGEGKTTTVVNIGSTNSGTAFTSNVNVAPNLFEHTYDPSQYALVHKWQATPAFYSTASLLQFFNLTEDQIEPYLNDPTSLCPPFSTIPYQQETVISDFNSKRTSYDLTKQGTSVSTTYDKPTFPDLVGGLLGSTTGETCQNVAAFIAFQEEMVAVAKSYNCKAPRWI